MLILAHNVSQHHAPSHRRHPLRCLSQALHCFAVLRPDLSCPQELHAPCAFSGRKANIILLHLPDLVRTSGHDGEHAKTADERSEHLEQHAALLCQSIKTHVQAQPDRTLIIVVCPWPQEVSANCDPIQHSCERAAQLIVSSFDTVKMLKSQPSY